MLDKSQTTCTRILLFFFSFYFCSLFSFLSFVMHPDRRSNNNCESMAFNFILLPLQLRKSLECLANSPDHWQKSVCSHNEPDEKASKDLSQKRGEETAELTVSLDSDTLDTKDNNLRDISISSGNSMKKIGPKKADVQSLKSSISKVSKASKASKGSKYSALSRKKEKVKKMRPKSDSVSRQSLRMSLSKINKRYSDASIYSRTSSINRSSSLMRSSRVSRLSVTLSQESKIDDLAMGLRKAKKSLGTKRHVEKMIKVDDIFHSDDISETSQVGEMEDEGEAQINVRYKMLELLRQLPDINDLSATSLLSPTKQKRIKIENADENEDLGIFVAPMSQFDEVPETQTVELQGMEEEDHSSSAETSSCSRSITLGSDDTLLNLPSYPSLEVELFTLQPLDERIQSFSKDIVEKMTEVEIRNSLVDFLGTEDREQRKLVNAICVQFVDDVIGRVVSKCEEESVRLLRLLDKEKLWNTLRSLLDQLNDESLIRNKLERMTTEHFMRKKRFVFIKTPKNFDDINYQRYKSALIDYDRQLEIEEKTNNMIQGRMADLRKEFQDQQIYREEKLKEFEQTVRQTLLQNDSFCHLENMVDNALTNMSAIHNEVSDMRLELIYAQHRYADMINKSEALEELGFGLKMREYLTRQEDAELLSLKIEERNDELNRLHMKINYDVHALAHLKCKEEMCRRTHNRMKVKLLSCMEWKTHFRQQIYQAKLKHNAIIREIYKMKTDGSLLHYPPLLLDFDKTVDEVRSKQKSVEKLRNNYKNLINRIKVAEEMLMPRKKGSISPKASRDLSIIDAEVIVTPLTLS
ncbi:CAP-Gly domain-containing linker protein 1 [Drosophila innubila]|uniref:CAP-Gly domain-containing linker protein 1 n=1 Tax=Drosophila innubila TaxID=198719 RepID=UPI00148BC761|nr:CAP-Gly domain-containing linker protein 1 [Drosophila innubila]